MEPQTLLFRDADLVVVHKPSGLLTHRGWASDRDTALTRARDMLGQRVFLPHRLDRATSGVLVLALDADTHRALGRAFEQGEVVKQYLALVRGHAPKSGTIDHPLRTPDRPEPRAAVTDYTLLGHASGERCSLLRVTPRTGRSHQIRRHLKHLSHPLIGDTRYGKGAINRHYRDRYGLTRLALHAEHIAFVHPHTGQRIAVTAPLSRELASVLEALGLASALTPTPGA